MSIKSSLRNIFKGYKIEQGVAIDLSSSSIKICKLKKNSFQVDKYDIKSLEKDVLTSYKSINQLDIVTDYISEYSKKYNLKKEMLSTFIPYNSVIIQEIKTPIFKNEYKLKSYLEEYITDSGLSGGVDVNDYDYLILDKGEEEQTVKLCIAKKDMSDSYEAVFDMLNLNLAVIDTEPFAIGYFTEKLLNLNKNKKNVSIIDFGFNTIRIYCFNDNKFIYYSDLKFDYKDLVINLISSHDFFKNIDINKPNYMEDVFKILEFHSLQQQDFIVESFINEIKKVIHLAKSNLLLNNQIVWEDFDIYLMGGYSLLPQIIENLKETNISQNINYIGDIFKGNINKNIIKEHMVRIYPTIALASWGINYDKIV